MDRFKSALSGKHLIPPKEPGPVFDDPNIQQDDIDFIRQAHILGKWGDVEYYGPGAAEAEERRARILGLR